MKVLSFISSLSLTSGGPSRSVPLLAKGLSEVGVDVTLMTLRSTNMNTNSLEGTSVKLKILEPGTTRAEMVNYILSEQFDIIQLQSVWDWCYHQIATIARKYHIPYIVTPRGMLEPWSLSQKVLKKKAALILYQKRDLDDAACVYTTAEMEAKNVIKLGVKSLCSVIPNGIDIDDYPCRTDHKSVKKQILFLSRIHVKKGIELLIDSWNDLQTEYPDWSLLIVGNGDEDYILHLKDKIEKMGLQKTAMILPPVFGTDKVFLYQSSSLFVLPSYSENFGMAIAEALSCGVPVITTEYTPWHFLNESRTGWCIPLNKDNLKRALREAINMDSEELFNMGQRGSTLVANRFGYRSVASKAKILFEWLLNGGVRPDFIYIE